MSDAFNKLKREKADREELRTRYIEQGIADYTRAAAILRSLEKSIDFAVDDKDVLGVIQKELKEFVEVINECIPAQIRTEYEARQASKTVEITGQRLM
jgi:hypothetical protein